jgi:hypothetical protein
MTLPIFICFKEVSILNRFLNYITEISYYFLSEGKLFVNI